MAAAEAELAPLPPEERVALLHAVEKLVALGPPSPIRTRAPCAARRRYGNSDPGRDTVLGGRPPPGWVTASSS